MVNPRLTQFPGNLLLEHEQETVVPTPSFASQPLPSSVIFDRPRSSPSENEGLVHREISPPLVEAPIPPIRKGPQERHILGGGMVSGLPLQRSSIWSTYAKTYRRELGGPVFVVYKIPATAELFAMKYITGSEANRKLQILRQIQDESFVLPHEVFHYNNKISIVSEYMAVSLDNVNSSACPPNEPQLAAIIHQVLNGIDYLISKNMMYGNLSCHTVLISRQGDVKIANPEECLETGSNYRQQGIQDIKALGFVMLQLMECGNAHQQLPLTLKDPTVWSEGAKEFLDQIISSSPKELLSHPFLRHSPQKEELVRLVDSAMLTSYIQFSLESPE